MVEVIANITVESKSNPLLPTDHAIRIRNDGNIPKDDGKGGTANFGTLGIAKIGGKAIYISQTILENTPDILPMMRAGTGLTSNANESGTLERTSAHELGHSAGQFDNPSSQGDDNLMIQTKRAKGTKVTMEQIFNMLEMFNANKLNQGNQEIK